MAKKDDEAAKAKADAAAKAKAKKDDKAAKAKAKKDDKAAKAKADAAAKAAEKAAFTSAMATDEAAARKRGLVVNEKGKKAAYALLKRQEAETAAWNAAKVAAKTEEDREKVAALRAVKKLTARELTAMRGKDCDSVQAAENVFYAEQEACRAKVAAEEAKQRALLAAEKQKKLEALGATVKAGANLGE